MNRKLTSSTIGAIRDFIDSQTSRGELKGLALHAGAKADRIMKIKVSSNMHDANYKSKTELMCEMIDTIYEDFEKPEADGIFIRMAGILLRERESIASPDTLQTLEQELAQSGLSLAQVTGTSTTADFLEYTIEQALSSDLTEASDLLNKGLRRLPTDKSGAITACTSACESICRIALEHLELPLPAKKQLPEYFDALCEQTNIMSLARISSDHTAKVFGSLRGLTRHSYGAAHELGDRHGHGNNAQTLTNFGADLSIISCAALATIIAGAIARDELSPISK